MGNLLAFILLIGPLIIFHELGHLVAAKLVDVKVNRFSVGFGPALLKLRLGETEYCLAPIPLGGYVSMLGHTPGEDVPLADADRAITNKPLWARYFVYSAGPIANLILPIFIFFFYFVIANTMVTPAVLGTVVDGSAADRAGLEQNDRIVAIEGRDVRSWTEMAKRAADNPGEELKVQIERDGKRIDRVVTPQKIVRKNALGIAEPRGRLGVIQWFYEPQVGIIDPESPAATQGLKTGDVITSINGEPVRTIEELEKMLEVTGGAVVRLTYLRPQPVQFQLGRFLYYESHHAQILPRKGGDSPTGLLPGRMFVRSVDPGSPAERAGVRAGDRVLAADGKNLHLSISLGDVLERKQHEPVSFLVQSPGQPPRDVEIALETRKWTTIYKQDREEPWLGIEFYDKHFISDPEPVRGRFTYALSGATTETLSIISMMWGSLVQMVTFERSVDELSSVVGIYKVAGTAYEQGPGAFLIMLASLSIAIGVFNFLPIPILDGGHLMFFTIEAVRRKPLGQRAREIASAVGLVVVLLLLLIATRNDILRYWL